MFVRYPARRSSVATATRSLRSRWVRSSKGGTPCGETGTPVAIDQAKKGAA